MTKKPKESKFHEQAKKWVWSIFLSLSSLLMIAALTKYPQIEQNRIDNVRQDKSVKELSDDLLSYREEYLKVLTEILTTTKIMKVQRDDSLVMQKETLKIMRQTRETQIGRTTKVDAVPKIIDKLNEHLQNGKH